VGVGALGGPVECRGPAETGPFLTSRSTPFALRQDRRTALRGRAAPRLARLPRDRCEFRYADAGRFLSGLLDYDVSYTSLNTALLVGNWQVTPATGLKLSYDYRNSQTQTTTNAINGQSVERVE
jgi:hypothetical protein